MAGIRKGCVVRLKARPHIKVWVIYADEMECYGIALTHDDMCCYVGDFYVNINLRVWELTNEFYDVAEVVTKMQEEKKNGCNTGND